MIGLAALLCGCGTLWQDNRTELQRIEGMARISAFVGAAVDLDRHPEHKPAFVLARNAVNSLLAGGEFSPSALREALAQLPVSELRADRAAIVITTALLLMEESGVSEPVQGFEPAAAVARGAVAGIDMALALHPD